MSTGQAIGERPAANAFENENTLIVDYWLGFLAATDEPEDAQHKSFSHNDLESTFERFARRTRSLSDDRVQHGHTTQEVCPLCSANGGLTWIAPQSTESPRATKVTGPRMLARGTLRLAHRLRKSALFELFTRRT